jgi:hypothetical protein
MHGRGSHTTSSWPSVRFGTQDAHTHFTIMLLVVDNIVRTTKEMSSSRDGISSKCQSSHTMHDGRLSSVVCTLSVQFPAFRQHLSHRHWKHGTKHHTNTCFREMTHDPQTPTNTYAYHIQNQIILCCLTFHHVSNSGLPFLNCLYNNMTNVSPFWHGTDDLHMPVTLRNPQSDDAVLHETWNLIFFNFSLHTRTFFWLTPGLKSFHRIQLLRA